MPSNTSPPGELIRTSTGFSRPIDRSAAPMRLAVTPLPDHGSTPIGSKIVICDGAPSAAAASFKKGFHFESTVSDISHDTPAGRESAENFGRFRRLTGHPLGSMRQGQRGSPR